jgi:hypothetical protein
MSIREAIDTLAGVTADQIAGELDRAEGQRETLAALLRVKQRAEESGRRVAAAVSKLTDKKEVAHAG